jgi:L-lactate dehydrogenase complex protein LldG
MERKQFLTQLRAQMPAQRPQTHHPTPRTQRVLTAEECLELFVARATAALTDVHICASDDEVPSLIENIIDGASFVNTGCHQFAHILTNLNGHSEQVLTEDKNVTYGISEARIGVALTGTCVLDAFQHRGGTLLPPRHIILLKAADIVPDLYSAYEFVGQSLRTKRTSVFAFHTGPSRSADIEQTMALGVHGPGDVHVIVVA